MRKIIQAFVLVLALAIPAFAGDIPYNVTGNIPNDATLSGVMQSGVTGDIPNNVTGDILCGATSQTTLIEVLLSLFSVI